MNARSLDSRSPRRRRLLKAAAASGLLAAVERNLALAQAAPDYKALVCIYLAGGNDGENTLIRFDSAGYQNYACDPDARVGDQHPAGAAAADPAGEPAPPRSGSTLRARRSRRCSTRRSSRSSPTSACWCSRRPGRASKRRARRGRRTCSRTAIRYSPSRALMPRDSPALAGAAASPTGSTRPIGGVLFPPLTTMAGMTDVCDRPHVDSADRSGWSGLHAPQQRRRQSVPVRRAARGCAARNPRPEPLEHLRRRRADACRGRAGRVVGRDSDPAEPDIGRRAVLREAQHRHGAQLQTVAQLIEGRATDAAEAAGVLCATGGLRHARRPGRPCKAPCWASSRRRSRRSRTR